MLKTRFGRAAALCLLVLTFLGAAGANAVSPHDGFYTPSSPDIGPVIEVDG